MTTKSVATFGFVIDRSENDSHFGGTDETILEPQSSVAGRRFRAVGGEYDVDGSLCLLGFKVFAAYEGSVEERSGEQVRDEREVDAGFEFAAVDATLQCVPD